MINLFKATLTTTGLTLLLAGGITGAASASDRDQSSNKNQADKKEEIRLLMNLKARPTELTGYALMKPYATCNKGVSYNLGTLWINGIPKEVDIFSPDDNARAENEAIRKLLWKDGDMQTPTNPRGTQIPFQLEFVDSEVKALKRPFLTIQLFTPYGKSRYLLNSAYYTYESDLQRLIDSCFSVSNPRQEPLTYQPRTW